MRDLTVYDSQGAPLNAEEHGQVNERIKDFFFGGVRIALESVGSGYKFTAFFRARDSAASRSEQYYGVLEAESGNELSNFREIIDDHMRNEYGKELVTSKEDTTVFEQLGSGSLRSSPGSRETRHDIADLVNEGEQALVGVGSYEDATTLLTDYLGDLNNPKIAIAENAQSSTLSGFSLVIEKGPYTGLELLGDTEQQIEDMKERKRREREQMLGGPAGAGPYGQQQQTGPFGLEPKRLFAVGGGVALILLLVVGTYGACFFGASVPFVGSPPLMDCGGGGGGDTVGDGNQAGPEINITSATMEVGNQASIDIEGQLKEDGTLINGSAPNETQTLNYTVERNGDKLGNGSVSTSVTNQGMFRLAVNESDLNATIRNESHNVTIEWQNVSDTVEVTPPRPDTPFEILNFGSSSGASNVSDGEDFNVTVELENNGSEITEEEVRLLVDDEQVDNETVSLGGGATTSTELTWPAAFGDESEKQLVVRVGETAGSDEITVSKDQ